MNETLSPLALATTDELIEELKGRVRGCLVILQMPRRSADWFEYESKGSVAECIGLCEITKALLLERAAAGESVSEDEEE